MFLTGFDAPTLNTLFVDKNLRFHGLMQAFQEPIVFMMRLKHLEILLLSRDLEQSTIDAITLLVIKILRM